MKSFPLDQAWQVLVQDYGLTKTQEAQLRIYFDELVEANELFNLTAITQPSSIIFDHFYDSLALSKFFDLKKHRGLADVGTGGGFPGIPLKIMFPELPVVLIEVTIKKVRFLERMCDRLNLDLITVYPLDWRTFLRTTEFDIDLFCSRASLQIDELARLFKPGCTYKDAQLVYWASKKWKEEEVPAGLYCKSFRYEVASKQRQLIEISNKPL